MINFDEEVKKFKPCLEVEDTEDTINAYEIKDVTDFLKEVLDEMNTKKK